MIIFLVSIHLETAVVCGDVKVKDCVIVQRIKKECVFSSGGISQCPQLER